ncbi:hypothetical protein CUV01_15950 [Paracoccus tegillarcae]|uniref:Glycosyltransferase 2-like domain-containing protein n=2 Tax=Paracoccus tegillarcae TaxID=1529068 RepID=A0A2K9EML0_9RHOB|nr:hypothetical protein CUV01_15950 [Paracoccus tegillarcae]
MCALLPNEEEILLNSVRKVLGEIEFNKKNELIVSIASIESSRVLADLRTLELSHGQLRVLLSKEIVGKFAQLNSAIKCAQNDLIYLLDADEYPVERVLERACRQHSRDEIWQGVTLPRNQNVLFEKIVGSETKIKYLVGLQFRALGGGNVYFCGSNAIWPRQKLVSLQFNNASLVEDVEISVRANLEGHQVHFKPWLIATELAPSKLTSWWIQRRRWAKGWLEVGQHHFHDLVVSKRLNWRQKYDWLYLIYLRRVVLATAWLTYFTSAALVITFGSINTSDVLFDWALHIVPLQLSVAIIQVAATSNTGTRSGLLSKSSVLYVLCFPFYELMKSAVALDAVRLSALGRHEWQVTPRGMRPKE